MVDSQSYRFAQARNTTCVVLRSWINPLLDLVLAPMCLACDSAIDTGDSARLVCRRCRARLRLLPPPCCLRCGAPLLRTGATRAAVCSECADWPAVVRFARSACLMHPPADRIIHQLKYSGWRGLAEPMAERMHSLELPAEMVEEVRLVVPVPTTQARRRVRGYNQAELLAQSFARLRGLGLFTGLQRARAVETQTALQPMERAANVAGAFRVEHGKDRIRGAHLLLVDDVLTTGATSAECATTLVAGGARCVSILTFARALDARRLTGS